jgi:hypothetical protein
MEGSELIQEEAAELIVPEEIIRPEVNFLLLPFFALSWKEVKKLTKIEYQVSVKRKGAEAKLSWTVLPSIEYGIPTPLDKELKGVVDAIISRTKKPISNPLELPYIAEIARMMSLEPNKNGKYDGHTYKKIKEAFKRMTLTGVESKGAFYAKGKRMWIDDTFHLYERVIFRGEKMLDGAVAEKNYIWLSSLYLDSINNNYVKPIDYTYFQSLKNCIAKRLYEFLGIKFYGLRKKREKFFRIGYLNLYQLLPITPQKSFSLIKKNLDPAHNELIQTGFLAEVEYEITKDRNSFNILYFPGERAIREMRGDWGAEIPELEAGQPLEIEAPKERTISEKSFLDESQSYDMELQYKEEMSPLVKELLNRGITKSVAVDFAKSFSEEHLREKIEIHDYKKEAGELNTNAAGWLREAIVCDYKPSEEQLKKQAKLLEKQAQQEEQRTLEEKAREIQETRLAEALASFPLDEKWVRERVMEHVNVRETTIKAFGGEQFTEAEIAEMYLRYQSQIPKTDEEKRGWLISHHREYALSAIIEELKKEQQKSQKEGSTGTINERLPCNSIGDVLAEVARQKAEFEAKQNGSEQEEK